VKQELIHAAAQDVPGRLVPADQDEQRLHEQLLVVQALAVDPGVHEDAHQVLARVPVPVLEDAALVAVVVVERGRGRGEALHRGRAGAEDHRLRPRSAGATARVHEHRRFALPSSGRGGDGCSRVGAGRFDHAR
jgi:hypothetical protein